MFVRALLILIFLVSIGFLSDSFSYAAESGNLITCPDFSAVYYIADDGSRWVFPNDKIYFSWYSDFNDVVEITCGEMGTYPIGNNIPYQAGTQLVKIQSVSTVYAVSPGAVLHAIDSENRAVELFGIDWAARVDDISDAFFPYYSVLDSVDSLGYPDGTIIRNSETGSYYFVEGDARRLVSSGDISTTLKSYSLERNAPFDGTTVGEDLSSFTWGQYEKLDREGESEIPVIILNELTAPTLEINTDVILNGEPYVLTWNDQDEDNENLLFELQVDSTNRFSSPNLLLNKKDTGHSITIDDQLSPKFFYRVRAKDNVYFSPWSNIIEVDVENYFILDTVVDTNMPISNKIGLEDSTSSSVAIAAANVLYYFDQILGLDSALGVTANKTVKDLADYLAWMMDINDDGSDNRTNDGEEGIYNADIEPALLEFIEWDGSDDPWQGFEVPEAMNGKQSFNSWTIEEIRSSTFSDSGALSEIANALKENIPLLGVFTYWNPEATGKRLADVRFYEMGESIDSSSLSSVSSSPTEYWNVSTDNTGSGHGVTVVGYIPNYDTDLTDDTDDEKDYVIVYDAWSTTFSHMAIPLDEWARFFILRPEESVAPQSTSNLNIIDSIASGQLVTISWGAAAKASYYELQWDNNGSFTSPEIFITTEFDGVIDYVDTHVVTEDSTFYYRVRPYNSFGVGDWGDTESLLVTF